MRASLWSKAVAAVLTLVAVATSIVVDVPSAAAVVDPPAEQAALPPATYAESVDADDPLLHWSLDELSGSVAIDRSGNESHGTYGVAVQMGLDPAIGVGTAVASNPGAITVGSTASPIAPGQDHTVELWSGFPEGGRDETRWMAHWGEAGIWTGDGMIVVSSAQESWVFALLGWSSGSRWSHLAVSFEDGEPRLTVDGQALPRLAVEIDDEVHAARPTAPGAGLSFGGDGGSVDEVALYDEALPLSRVRAHWRAGLALPPCDATPTPATPLAAEILADQPDAYYDMELLPGEPPLGAVAVDRSGQCRHAAAAGLSRSGDQGVGGGAAHIGAARFGMIVLGDRALGSATTVTGWVRGEVQAIAADQLVRLGIGDYEGTGPWIDDDVWHHVAIVREDGEDTLVYLDGERVDVELAEHPFTGMPVRALGGTGVDEVAFYPTALAPGRVRAQWLAGSRGSATEPDCSTVDDDSPYALALAPDEPGVRYRLGSRTAGGQAASFQSDVTSGCIDARAGPAAAADPADVQVADGDGSLVIGGGDGTVPVLVAGGVPAHRTLEVWTDLAPGAAGWVARLGNGQGIWVDGTSVWVTSLPQPGGPPTATLPAAPDGWHLWTMVVGAADQLVSHLDGQALATVPLEPAIALQTLTIGGAPGRYDEVATFPEALSPARIAAHVAGRAGYPTTVTLAGSPATWVGGATATLTATVASTHPAAGTPEGTVVFLDGDAEVGRAPTAAGEAALVTPPLTTGRHRFRARFEPTSTHLASTSTVLSRLARTPGELVVDVEPADVLPDVQAVVTIAVGPVPGESAPATGTVTLTVDGAPGGQVALVDGGAEVGIGPLAIGPHQVVAAYVGDAEHPATVAAPVAWDVVPHRTEIVVDEAPVWMYADEDVPAVAGTVRREDGSPVDGGTIAVTRGSTAVATLAVGTDGRFAALPGQLAAGMAGFDLHYSEPSGRYRDVSGRAEVGIAHRPSIAVTNLTGGTVFRGQVHAYAVVTASDGTRAEGEVNLRRGWFDSRWLDAEPTEPGRISYLAPLAEGTNTYEVRFEPEGSVCRTDRARGTACDGFGPSAGTVELTQQRAATRIEVDQVPDGDGTELWVRLRSDDPTAAGSPLDGDPVVMVDGVKHRTSDGCACVQISGIAPGPHRIQASFPGRRGWLPSSFDEEIVVRAPTRVAFDLGASTARRGDVIEVEGTVEARAGGTTPTGSVTIAEAGATSTVEVVGGPDVEIGPDGTFTTELRIVGTGWVSLTASYGGDAAHLPSTTYDGLTVTGRATTTTIELPEPETRRGGFLDATVYVTAAGGGAAPTGHVEMLVDGVVVDTQPMYPFGAAGSGVARSRPYLSSTPWLGDVEVSARYVPDGQDGPSASGTATATIVMAPTEIYIYPSPEQLRAGGGIVVIGAGGHGEVDPEDLGELTLRVDGEVVGVEPAAVFADDPIDVTFAGTHLGTLPSTDVRAEVAVDLAPGTYALTVDYTGSGELPAGSSTQAREVTVLPALPPTTVTAVVEQDQLVRGEEALHITAQVASEPGAGRPEGTVTATLGGVELGTLERVPESDAPGDEVAHYERWLWPDYGIPPGQHDLVLSYQGQDHAPSTSAPVPVTLLRSPSYMYFEPSPLIVEGEPLVLDPWVGGHSAYAPHPWTLTIFVDGVEVERMDGDDDGPYLWAEHVLPVGTHQVEAVFSGSDWWLPSREERTVTVVPDFSLTATPRSSTVPRWDPVVLDLATTGPVPWPTESLFVREVDEDGDQIPGGYSRYMGAPAVPSTISLTDVPVGAHRFEVMGRWGWETYRAAYVEVTVERRAAAMDVTLPADPVVDGAASVRVAVSTPGRSSSLWGQVVVSVDGVARPPVPLQGGVATASLTFPDAGSHEVTASFAGNADVQPVAATRELTVRRRTTTLSATTTASPVMSGQPVVVRVSSQVSPAMASGLAGTVTLTDRTDGETVELGQVDLTGGVGQLEVPAGLALGQHTLTISWPGDRVTAPDDVVVDVVVLPAGTTTALRVDPEELTVGEAATLTATVAVDPLSVLDPVGEVVFYDDAQEVGRAELSDGEATLVVQDLPAGQRRYRAVYEGTARLAPSRSTIAVRTARRPAKLTVDLPDSAVSGEKVPVAIAVAPAGGLPGTVVGAVRVALDGTVVAASVPLVAGAASTTVVVSTSGTRAITVTYLGSAFHQPTTTTAELEVDRAASRVDVDAAPGWARPGAAIPATVRVTTVAPGTGTPTGTVTAVVGSSTVEGTLDGQGVAHLSLPGQDPGDHEISVTYEGDDHHHTSHGTAEVAVRPATELVLTTTASTITLGEAATLTAEVVISATGAPATGHVEFVVGQDVVRRVALDSDGRATLDARRLAAGTTVVRAVYDGGGDLSPSDDSVQILVRAATPGVAVTADTDTAQHGERVVLTAVVTGPSPAHAPRGTVTFHRDGVALGSATVATDGTAARSVTNLGVGTSPVTAVYASSNGNHTSATSPGLPITVTRASTRVDVTAPQFPTPAGATTSITVRVRRQHDLSPVATGTPVEVREGGVVVQQRVVQANGAVTFDIERSLGRHVLTVHAAGTEVTEPSVSPAIPVDVGQPVSVHLVQSGPATGATYYDWLDLLVSVTPSSGTGPAPAGRVQIRHVDRAVAEVPLGPGGTALVRVRVPAGGLSVFSARYLGDPVDPTYGTGSSLAYSHTAAERPTIVTAEAPRTSGSGRTTQVNVGVVGQPTGAANDPVPPPSGLVTIHDDAGVERGRGRLNGYGHASITVSDLTAATTSLTARYRGDGIPLDVAGDDRFLASASTPLPHTVVAPIVAVATASRSRILEKGSVTFSAADTTGPATSYRWRFGDGEEATGPEVTHTFQNPGRYTVALIAQDDPVTPDQAHVTTAFVLVASAEPPAAVAGADRVVEEDTSVTFDGGASLPRVGIDLHRWEFIGPAGTSPAPADLVRVNRSFSTPGEYVARLTVFVDGVAFVDEARVHVKAAPPPGSGMPVLVTNTNGVPLRNARVMVMDQLDGEYATTTGNDGRALITGLANGKYSVYAIAEGHRPAMVPDSVVVSELRSGLVTVRLQEGVLGTATISHRRVQPEEFGRLGIDPTDPDNQTVVEYTIPIAPNVPPVKVQVNSAGGCFCPTRWAPDPSNGGGGGGDTVHVYQPRPGVVATVHVPGSARFTKEFFEVTLTVHNLTPASFSMTDGTAYISLPKGLTLATLAQPQSVEVPVDLLQGGESFTHRWIVRGDEEGRYTDVSAGYTGVLQPFGDVVRFDAKVPANDPIVVEGTSRLAFEVVVDDQSHNRHDKLTYEDEGAIEELDQYLFDPYDIQRFAVRNNGSSTMVNLSVDLAPEGAGPGFLVAPYQQSIWRIDRLDPGEVAELDPVTLFPFLERSGDLADLGLPVNGQQRPIDEFEMRPPTRPKLELGAFRGEDAEAGAWNLKWEPFPGAERYELWSTSSQETPFAQTPDHTVLRLGAGQESASIPASLFTSDEDAQKYPRTFVLVSFVGGKPVIGHTLFWGAPEFVPQVLVSSATWVCFEGGEGAEGFDGIEIVVWGAEDGLTSLTVAEVGGSHEVTFENPEGTVAEEDPRLRVYTVQAEDIFDGEPPDGAEVDITVRERGDDDVSEPVRVQREDCGDGQPGQGGSREEESRGDDCRPFLYADQDVRGETIPTTNCPADPVNMLTGNLVVSGADAELPGPGIPFAFERTYNSLDTSDGPLGIGWTHTYNTSLAIAPDGSWATYRASDGAQIRYVRVEDGSYAPTGPTTMRLVRRTFGTPEHPGDPGTGGLGWDATTLDGTRYHFDDAGRLLTVRDRNGEGPTLHHTGTRLTSITYNGWTVTVGYNSGGRISSLQLPGGRTVTYTYSGAHLIQVIDLAAKVTRYEYDAGRLAREYLTGVLVHHTRYGADGRVVSQTDGEGGLTTFTWDAAKGLATMTDPEQNAAKAAGAVVLRHDQADIPGTATIRPWTEIYEDGRLIHAVDPLRRWRSFQYDDRGLLLHRDDVGRARTSFTYDPRGNLLTRDGPLEDAATEVWTYRADDQVETFTDVMGRTTTLAYDALGRPEVVDPVGRDQLVTRYTDRGLPEWTCSGELCSAEGDGDGATHFAYDAHGRVIRETSPEGRATVTEYTDSAPRTVDVFDPRADGLVGTARNAFRTRVELDGFDRPVRYIPSVGAPYGIAYDGRGNVVRRTRGTSIEVTGYDATGLMVSHAQPGAEPTRYAYDANGNLVSVESPTHDVTRYDHDAANQTVRMWEPVHGTADGHGLGWMWQYRYDAYGHVDRTTAPDGTTTTALNDAAGRPRRVTTIAGTTSYDYRPDGHLASTTTADGVESWRYDDGGRVERHVDLLGNVTSYGYDHAGRLRSVGRPDGETMYEHDADGLLTAVTDPRGTGTSDPADYRTTYQYDDAGNRELTIDPHGGEWETDYDGGNRITATRTALGFETTYTYDTQDRPKTVTVPPTGPNDTSNRTRTYVYDDFGFEVELRHPNGPTTTRYDDAGRVASVTTPAGTTSYGYDGNGRVDQVVAPGPDGLPAVTATTYSRTTGGASPLHTTAVRDPDGRVTTTAVDALGRVVHETAPGGAQTSYAWTATGRLREVTGPVSDTGERPVSTYSYSRVTLPDAGYGLRQTRTDPRMRSWRTVTDHAGRLVRATSPEGRVTEMGYDPVGNLVRQVDPGGLVTEQDWDARNDMVERRTPGTAPTVYRYDADGRMDRVTAPNGSSTTLTRDGRGNVRVRTAEDGTTEQLFYNNADQLTQRTDQLGRRWFWLYDSAGRLARSQDAVAAIDYEYDPAGNVKLRRGTRNGVVRDETFTWSPGGLMLTASNPLGSTTYDHDAAGRVESVTSPAGELEYVWNPDGTRDRMTSAQGVVTDYESDVDARLLSMTTTAPGEPAHVAAFTTTPDGLPWQERVDGDLARVTTYDPASGLPDVVDDRVSGRVEDLDHEHGRLVERTVTGSSGPLFELDYDYDPAGQLERATEAVAGGATTVREYEYTDTGAIDWSEVNGVRTDHTYDDARQLVSTQGPAGLRTMVYDAAGRRRRETFPGGSRTSTYGVMGRHATTVLTGALGAGTETLEYDAEGRLSEITVDGDLSPDPDAPVTHELVWDAQRDVPQVVDLIEPDDPVSLVHGARRLAAVATDRAGDLTADALGNPVATGQGSDALLRGERFGPYGENSTLGAEPVGFGYLGELRLPSGFVHLRAREYDPMSGSFTTPDPLDGVPGTTTFSDPYPYAFGDPINVRDPLGLRGEDQRCRKTGNWFARNGSAALCQTREYIERTPIGTGLRFAFDQSFRDRFWDMDWGDRVDIALTGEMNLDDLQVGLEIAGLIPGYGEAFDLVNAVIYFARGKNAEGAVSLFAALPIVGWGGNAARAAGRTDWVTSKLDEIAGIFKWGDDAGDGAAQVQRWADDVIDDIAAAPTPRQPVPGAGTVDDVAPPTRVADPPAPSAADGPAPTRGPPASSRASSSASSPGGACRINSFVPGTAVLMADGSSRAIEDVELGDLVWAEDPATGEVGPRRVTDLITGFGTKELVTLTTEDGATVVATDEHPLWVEGEGWTDADDLAVGDLLRDDAGASVAVTAVAERTVTGQRVHNLTVDDLHTYFVLAGETSLLTHNDEHCASRAAAEAQRYADELMVDAASGRPIAGANLGDHPTVAAAAVDRRTGEVFVGHSAEFRLADGSYSGVHPDIESRLPNPSLKPWSSSNCAEVAACSRALAAGSDLADLQVAAVRIAPREPMSPCANCRSWLP